MSDFERLSAYRVMWAFVFFDLPTETKKQRKAYADFRKKLQKDGFTMMQYSVYYRHAPSREVMDKHIRLVERALPKEGKVSMMLVTDKQFGDIKHYWCAIEVPPPDIPYQISMF